MITLDLKVNGERIFSIMGVRYPGAPAKGTNAYVITLIDQGGTAVKKDLVTHAYEDGALKLASRMAGRFFDLHKDGKIKLKRS